MPPGKRKLRNLPSPEPALLPGLSAADYDWRARLYDVISDLDSRVDGLGDHVDHVYQSTEASTLSGAAGETGFAPTYTPDPWLLGMAYRVRASGVLSTAAGDPSVTLRLRLGTTLLLATPAVMVLGGPDGFVTDAPWSLEVLVVCRLAGAPGVLSCSGDGFLAAGGLASSLANTSMVAPDLTAGLALTVTAEWSSAAGNEVTLESLSVERLPAP